MSQNKKKEKMEGGRERGGEGRRRGRREGGRRFALYIPYVILPFSLRLVK